MGAPAFLPCVAIGSASVVRPGCFVSRQPPNFVRPATYRKKRSSSIVLCLAQSATDSSESEEGVVLDENAMRAAEIHEVLVGLEDFKARIVEDATRLAKKVRGKYFIIFVLNQIHTNLVCSVHNSTEETTRIVARETSRHLEN